MNIDIEFHKRKRTALLSALSPHEVLMVTSSYPAWKSRDQYFPFKQDTNFLYLTGLDDIQNAMVIITHPDAYYSAKEWLVVPRPDLIKARWEGGVHDADYYKEKTGFSTVIYMDEFDSYFSRLLNSNRKVLLNIPEFNFSPLSHPAKDLLEKIKSAYPLITFESAIPAISRLRVIKENAELNRLKQAISVTNEAIKRMVNAAPAVTNEYELEAEFWYELNRHNVKKSGYEPIIAAGKNATILHYTQNNAGIQPHSLILADVGAEFENYTADVTRTFSSGQMTDRQQQLYQAVKKVNEMVIDAVKPGIVYQSLNELAKSLLTDAALELNLIKKPDDVGQVYMHRVSHFLGLDVHDVGTYDYILQPGMVITIEPGLYVDDEDIGIRIEDDVLVTENGCEVLTSQIEK